VLLTSALGLRILLSPLPALHAWLSTCRAQVVPAWGAVEEVATRLHKVHAVAPVAPDGRLRPVRQRWHTGLPRHSVAVGARRNVLLVILVILVIIVIIVIISISIIVIIIVVIIVVVSSEYWGAN
jgi:hypothetical protein